MGNYVWTPSCVHVLSHAEQKSLSHHPSRHLACPSNPSRTIVDQALLLARDVEYPGCRGVRGPTAEYELLHPGPVGNGWLRQRQHDRVGHGQGQLISEGSPMAGDAVAGGPHTTIREYGPHRLTAFLRLFRRHKWEFTGVMSRSIVCQLSRRTHGRIDVREMQIPPAPDTRMRRAWCTLYLADQLYIVPFQIFFVSHFPKISSRGPVARCRLPRRSGPAHHSLDCRIAGL